MSNPPLDFLQRTTPQFPSSIWAFVDKLRADKGISLPDWPQYVFLPFSGWYAATCLFLHKRTILDMNDMTIMHDMAVAGTWRLTQDVVRFDADVYASIIDTPITGDLPFDVFYRLPAWAIYIETRDMVYSGVPVHGFWAMLEHDTKDTMGDESEELRLFFLSEKGRLLPVVLQFGDGNLETAIQRVIDSDIKQGLITKEIVAYIEDTQDKEQNMRAITQAVNLLLYVCAYGFPNRPRNKSGEFQPHRPTMVKTKKGWRLFPAQRITYHDMGEDIGNAIREYKARPQADSESRTHASPRPHVRRAHWHGFWYGGKKMLEDGTLPERRFSLKWLPPIPVAMKEDDIEE